MEMESQVVVLCFLFTTVLAAGSAEPYTVWEKTLIVLTLMPIVVCLYMVIVLFKTANELKKIKELTASLLKHAEAIGISAAKASLGPSVKNALLEYAKTVREFEALKQI